MEQQNKLHNKHRNHNHMVRDFKKRFLLSIIITLPILLLSPMISSLLGIYKLTNFRGKLLILFALSTCVFLYGGYPFLKGFYLELKKKRPGMMTLIAIAITTAYIYSSLVVFGVKGKIFFWELATLIDIMLLGHWIEMKSVMGASKALEELAKLMPSEAHRILEDGTVKDIPLNKLNVGDIVLIKPGEKIPADGIIVDGSSTVDESLLTGESKPVFRKKGNKVIGGSINGEGSLKVKVQKTGKDSFLSQVIELVKKAKESKSRTQDLANRAAFWLTIIALSAGGITFFVWKVFLGKDFAFSLERSVTVMVITCPHALGLAIPLVVAVSTVIAAKKGFLIRNRTAFERAKNLSAVVFDKTGTLTVGNFGVTGVETFKNEFSKDDILSYASSLEMHSEHPIAKAIASSASAKFDVEGFNSIPGKGVKGKVNGRDVMVVSPGFLKEMNFNISGYGLEDTIGKTTVYVLIDNDLAGRILLSDVIRNESKKAIISLKKMGIKCLMLTGDNREVAKWVSDEIGLDGYFAEVLPQEKSNKIREIKSKGEIVAMVGDGVNDAPALVEADVGIGIGAGTDVAIESADIVLVKNNPLDVVSVINVSKKTYRKMVQNLIWATSYNILAIPLAAGIFYGEGIVLTPAIGAVLMSLSTVIVAINAKLLKL